jgi:hypothetical protein
MKNFTNLIDSVNVKIANVDFVNMVSLTNLDINYKIMSSWSQETLNNVGPSLGIYKDTGLLRPVGVPDGGSALGVGECHNEMDPVLFTTADGNGLPNATGSSGQDAFTFNEARIERSRSVADLTDNTNAYLNQTSASSMGKNFCVRSGYDITYHILATIRLKDMHDIFRKLPLTRGMYMYLNIRTNCFAKCEMSFVSSKYTSYNSVSSGSTLPFQISPIGQGVLVSNNVATQTLTAELGIGALASNGVKSAHGPNCRLYTCMYQMTPEKEAEYFSLNPVKRVIFNDINVFKLANVANGASISHLVATNIARVRSILIVPKLSGSVHGATNITDSNLGGKSSLGDVLMSPFSSAGSTCAPYAYLNNFNVLLGSVPFYKENINYSWQQFLLENRSSNALNGGVVDEISSGVLSQEDYYNGYGFIFVDLSRKQSQARDDEGKSIEIRGTNQSGRTLDFDIVVNFQRELKVSTSTGGLVW